MQNTEKTLGMLVPGESGRVRAVSQENIRTRRRLIDMGITPGAVIHICKRAPMGDPIEIALRGYRLSIRKADADSILLMNEAEESEFLRVAEESHTRYQEKAKELVKKLANHDTTDQAAHERAARLTEQLLWSSYEADASYEREPVAHEVRIALAGNPNCGKTTLFNAMTGAKEYVGNWPGVTVEKKEGKIKTVSGEDGSGFSTKGHQMTLVDLPGIYSLSPYSMEERIARNYIIAEQPDAIINIVDGTNLERNLYLTVQLMELERPMIVALNMMDEVEKRGDQIDCRELSLALGVPVIPISARTGQGIEALIASAQRVIFAVHSQMHEGFHIEPDDVYDDVTHVVHHKIGELIAGYAERAKLPVHWAEIKVLEGDELVLENLQLPKHVAAQVEQVVRQYTCMSVFMDSESMVADSRYRYIANVTASALTRTQKSAVQKGYASKLDRILTNKYLALPLFALIMCGIFMLTFGTLGAFLSDLLGGFIGDTAVPFFSETLAAIGAPAWFCSLFADGILSSVGGVLTFLPQIAILFLCLSVLEDSGYMSRIAFIMDKPMRKFGLTGKSFIPLLMGFGCTVPAAMSARTMENEKDKRMTVLLTPFMSCSAKLPVYGLIVGAFFEQYRGLVVIGLYLIGILVGVLSGLLFKKTLFSGEEAPFIEELPPYRIPTLKNTLIHVWERVSHFLVKAGTILLAMGVVMWFLEHFTLSLAVAEQAEDSILASLGNLIAPVFTPLGFGTWQAAVALLSGVVAKEAVVSSFSLFYGFSAAAGAGVVRSALSGTFSPLSAFSFLVFVLLYTPCLAATTTMARELGSKKYALISIVYQILIAYAVSFFVYTLGLLFV